MLVLVPMAQERERRSPLLVLLLLAPVQERPRQSRPSPWQPEPWPVVWGAGLASSSFLTGAMSVPQPEMAAHVAREIPEPVLGFADESQRQALEKRRLLPANVATFVPSARTIPWLPASAHRTVLGNSFPMEH